MCEISMRCVNLLDHNCGNRFCQDFYQTCCRWNWLRTSLKWADSRWKSPPGKVWGKPQFEAATGISRSWMMTTLVLHWTRQWPNTKTASLCFIFSFIFDSSHVLNKRMSMQFRLTCRGHNYITHFSYPHSGAQCRRRGGVTAIIGSFFSPAARSSRGLQSCQKQNSQKPLLTCRLRKVKMITCLEIGVLCRRIVGLQEQNRLWVTQKQSCNEGDWILFSFKLLIFFLAKSDKIQKGGHQVESLKYMHVVNALFSKIWWFLLFLIGKQPAST